MFEHVNGEAELLKRYGAERLVFTYYENKEGDYLSVELLDMGKPINAYGLYRLYVACDNGEYQVAGATVTGGDYTSFAMLEGYFLRINAESGTGKGGKVLVDTFLQEFVESITTDTADKWLNVLAFLQGKARKPCEVGYHPEHLDYDLESGPGYTWIGPDGQSYYLNVLSSASAAKQHAEKLEQKGVNTSLVSGRTVIWQKADTPLGEYAAGIATEITGLLK